MSQHHSILYGVELLLAHGVIGILYGVGLLLVHGVISVLYGVGLLLAHGVISILYELWLLHAHGVRDDNKLRSFGVGVMTFWFHFLHLHVESEYATFE